MEKKDMRLYNAVFPIWLLWLFPVTWLVALPANFLIDLLVVVLTMVRLKIPDNKKTVKCTIWKVWIAGFIADFAGALAMSAMVLLLCVLYRFWGRGWLKMWHIPLDRIHLPIFLRFFG